MSLSRIIPLTSLAIVVAVLILGSLFDGPAAHEQLIQPADLDLPEVELGLGEITLLGELVDERGDPVPDAGITTSQAGRPLWTWSAKDGAFQLRELRPGPLTLRVVALGFEATRFEVEVPSKASGGPMTIVLDRRIGPPPTPPSLEIGDLAGIVRFGPRATPDRGYEVLLQPTTPAVDPNGGFPRRAAVEKDGSFRVDLLHAGPYRAILLSPDDRGGLGPDLLVGPGGEERLFVHETGGDTPRLELAATMAAVVGEVLRAPNANSDPGKDGGSAAAGEAEDATSPKPVRGALVRVEARPAPEDEGDPAAPEQGRDAFLFRAVQSDPAGHFEVLDLPPGDYVLSVVAGRQRTSIEVSLGVREVATIPVQLPD